jgi:hypothetical protein
MLRCDKSDNAKFVIVCFDVSSEVVGMLLSYTFAELNQPIVEHTVARDALVPRKEGESSESGQTIAPRKVPTENMSEKRKVSGLFVRHTISPVEENVVLCT